MTRAVVMRVAWVLMLASTGCRYFIGDGPAADPDDPLCGFGGPALADDGLCLDALPTQPLVIGGSFDTVSDSRCVAYSGDGGLSAYCVVAGTDVTLAGTFVGRRPLVVIALGSITIGDRVDISAQLSGDPAPAGTADGSACDPGIAGTQKPWGGAGGSFGGRGGDGGRDSGLTPCTDTCTAGVPIALSPPTALRGGCRGQDAAGAVGAPGGLGGGALALIARTTIEVTAAGSVDASGGAGGGGQLGGPNGAKIGGGGGGGSGGMIILDAPELGIAGLIFADGGGGGEGSTSDLVGGYGDLPTGLAPAAGGATQPTAGDGGRGSFALQRDADPGATQSTAVSGGGGGGGAGVIWLHGALNLAGTISPEPIVIGS